MTQNLSVGELFSRIMARIGGLVYLIAEMVDNPLMCKTISLSLEGAVKAHKLLWLPKLCSTASVRRGNIKAQL